ncbi:hypothetical protein [Pseudonocardia alni]|uniref:hypothetical protein n=1 Tax=Pseudonocardia alni TaxID=33907 RepID=UPI0031D8EC18
MRANVVLIVPAVAVTVTGPAVSPADSAGPVATPSAPVVAVAVAPPGKAALPPVTVKVTSWPATGALPAPVRVADSGWAKTVRTWALCPLPPVAASAVGTTGLSKSTVVPLIRRLSTPERSPGLPLPWLIPIPPMTTASGSAAFTAAKSAV